MVSSYFYKGNISFKDKLFALDYKLIFLILLLGIISFFAMYSTERGSFSYYTQSHVYRFFLFFTFFIVFSFFKLNFWHKFAYPFYFLILVLLIGVDTFGVTASGSKRWVSFFFFNLQPSELMKIGLIIFLAKYYNNIPTNDVSRIRYMILQIIVIFIPVAMVIKQPDLGTALLIAIAGLIIVWLAGVRIKYFLFSFVSLICLLPVVISFLQPYQKLRILNFLNPERDPLGAGYQILQSKIAVGSGGFFGKGFLQGSQSYLDYLPEKHTDFIFTLFSEEFGFIGCLVLLLIYVMIIYRLILIGNQSKSNFAKLYCFGFAASFFVCVAVNMCMVLGLLPIVGAPLPIMSYGGSSMLSIMIGLGMAMSFKVHSQEITN